MSGAFPEGREDEDVGGADVLVGVGFASCEVNFGADTEREGQLFEALAVFAVADDDEFGGDLFEGDGEGLDEGSGSLSGG